MSIRVTRKDQNEANENVIRRFNRKVLQSGMMPLKKSQMRYTKPISKRERRIKAIIREAHKADKIERIKLGLPPSSQDEALSRYSVSGEAPR